MTDTSKILISIRVQHYLNTIAKRITLRLNIMWLANIKGPIRSRMTKIAFKTAVKSRKWNQDYYDEVVRGMYVGVRKKEAFKLKERIIDARKGSQHVKMLMIETPKGEIEIELKRQDYPNLYDMNKN